MSNPRVVQVANSLLVVLTNFDQAQSYSNKMGAELQVNLE